MMTRKEIDAALKKRPSKRWSGEPGLGSVYGEEEIQAALDAVKDSMNYEKGFGFTSQPIVDFENAFANYVGTKHAIAVNSCGPGIDIVMRFLKLEPGDEVIVPPCNFIAAPISVYGNGGQVVWGDVIKETLELDPADVERKITPRTRAIFPVHMNGLSALSMSCWLSPHAIPNAVAVHPWSSVMPHAPAVAAMTAAKSARQASPPSSPSTR